jgi:hypothetical protein
MLDGFHSIVHWLGKFGCGCLVAHSQRCKRKWLHVGMIYLASSCLHLQVWTTPGTAQLWIKFVREVALEELLAHFGMLV